MPSQGITAGPYSSGIALKDTASHAKRALLQMIPDCLIHNVSNQQLIELKDGSKANCFEIVMNVGGLELISAFVTAQKNDRLIVFGAADKQGESMEDLTAMVKFLRLDVEMDEAALKARGYAQDGKFVRTNSPAFTLNNPKAFQNRVLELKIRDTDKQVNEYDQCRIIGYKPLLQCLQHRVSLASRPRSRPAGAWIPRSSQLLRSSPRQSAIDCRSSRY